MQFAQNRLLIYQSIIYLILLYKFFSLATMIIPRFIINSFKKNVMKLINIIIRIYKSETIISFLHQKTNKITIRRGNQNNLLHI